MTELPKKRRWLRRLIALLLTLLLLPVILFALLQTPPGKGVLASLLSSVASSAMEQEVRVTGLRGFLPFSVRIDEFSIADSDGAWLGVSDFEVSWSLKEALAGCVHVVDCTAESVEIERIPPGKEKPKSTELTIPEIPSFLKRVFVDELAVKRLALGEALVGAPAEFSVRGSLMAEEGAAAQLLRLGASRIDGAVGSLDLQAGLRGEPRQLTVSLNAVDEPIVSHFLKLESAKKSELQFEGSGLVTEWSGQLSARVDSAPVVELRVTSSAAEGLVLSTSGRFHLTHPWLPESLTEQVGPTCDFEIAAELPDKESLTVKELALSADQCSVSLAGTLDFATQRADASASLEYKDLSVLMELPEDAPHGPLQASVTAKGPLNALEGTLAVNLVDERLLESNWQLDRTEDLHARAEVRASTETALLPPQLAALEEVTASLDIRRTDEGDLVLDKTSVACQAASVNVVGILNPDTHVLDVQYDVVCRDLAMLKAFVDFDTAGAFALQGKATGDDQRLTVTVDARSDNTHFTPDAQWANAEFHIEAESRGWPDQPLEQAQARLSGHVTDAVFAGVPEAEITLNAAVNAPTQEDIQLTEFSLTDTNATVSATGHFNASTQAGQLDLTATVGELARVLSPLGSEVSGGAKLTADAVASEGLSPITIRLNGQAVDLDGLPEAALAALGPEATLEAEAVVDKAGARVARLTASGAGAEARATADFGFEQTTVAAEVTMNAPDLSVFGPSLGKTLAGTAGTVVTLSGTLDNLTVDCSAEGESLAVGDMGAESARLTASIEGLPETPKGPFELRLTSQGETMTGKGRLAFAESELLVDGLRVEAGENTIDGSVRFGTGSGALDVRVAADFPNLDTFGQILQQSLKGNLEAEAALSGQDGAYSLSADVKASSVESPFASFESATIAAEFDGPPLAPKGAATVRVAALRAPQAAVDSLELKADSDGSRVNVNLTADGAVQDGTPFDLAAVGSISDEGGRMALAEFSGQFASYPLSLEKPLVVARNGSGWDIEPFALMFDTCTMEASGAYAEDHVALSYAFRDLSLGLAEAFGGPAMHGTASGTVQVSGTPAAPVLDTAVQCTGLHLSAESDGVPAFDIDANTRITGGSLELTTRATMKDEANVQVEAAVPLSFSLSPWAFAIQDSASLAGTLEADVNLDAVPKALGATDHVLKGRLEGRFDLGGVVGSPVLVGDLAVTDARYENAATGTILDEIDLLLRAEKEALRLARCTATDGGSGGVELTGAITLEPESHFPFEGQVAFRKAQLARSDRLSGRVDGALNLTGTSKGASLKGDLVLGPASVLIPERLPPSVAEVEVEEINAPGTDAPEEDAEKPSPYPVSLDVKCRIPGRVYVRATPLDSEWKGDLEVKGTAAKPEIKGLLTVERGTLMFLSRNFALNDSTISLDGQSPPDPYLRIKAESRLKDMLARLSVSGTASELQFELSSDPSLPQDEILARLLFGRDLAQTTPLQALQIARTARMLSGRSGGLTTMSGQHKLPGVDRVQLKQADGGNDVAVEVGKYLTEDIYLDLEQGMGTSGSKASVGMEVTPQISVEGHVGSEAQSGLGIFWKKNY